MPETSNKKARKVWIPRVSRTRILKLAERIKPVVFFCNKGLCYIAPVDLFNESFIWKRKATKKATGLKPLCEIRTNHSFAYHYHFKPTIAEVLAQIPREHLKKVIAFEITDYPESHEDLQQKREATRAGYHVAITQLYVRAFIH